MMANLFIIASKQFGSEILKAENGRGTVNVNKDVMRKIWDYFYIPYISGHYYSYGKFRSDDAKVGDILAYVGSTSSAAYFPKEVTFGGEVYAVEAKILPVPTFEGGASVMVQQGAGMVISKGTPEAEYASIVFLKWLTETQNNIDFAAASGYLPVKKESLNYDHIKSAQITEITSETLRIAIECIQKSEL